MPNRLLLSIPSLLSLVLVGCLQDSPNDSSSERLQDSDEDRSRDDSEAVIRRSAGIPFALADGVTAAGYGLNTNDDGIQNYGELAVDCGGAGDSFCADTVPLDVQVLFTDMLDFNGYAVEWTAGTINGRQFQMLRPLEGQGLARTSYGTIVEMPSRLGNAHAPPEPYPFLVLTAGQEQGAVAIAMSGVTGVHPYVFSAQEAVLAARYLRDELDIERIVVSGSSYGGAVSAVDVSLHPAYFDGVVVGAAPNDPRTFVAWSEYSALRGMGSSQYVVDRLYYPPLDSMAMAAAQADLTIDNLDLTRPEDAVRPATFILGEIDPVWHPGTRPEEDRARMAEEGVENVTFFVGEEEGHGGTDMNAEIFGAFEPLYLLFDDQPTGTTDPGSRTARARERDTTYDEVLRSAPTLAPSRQVTELWSDVTQLEGGDAAHAVLAADGAFFAGSVQGFVTRRADDDSATVAWSVPVGRAVQALAHIDGYLVVGSKRGIAVLDPDTGALLREVTDIGSVHDVVVADLIPDVAGLEVAARADMDLLHVESLTDGTVLSSSRIGTGGAMMVSSATGDTALLAPLQAGHVAAFTFAKSGAEWLPVAQWLSPYLAHDVQVVQEATLSGDTVLLTGGLSYGEGRTPSLIIDDLSGTLDAIALAPYLQTVKNILPWTSGTVLVAGTHRSIGEAIVQVDLTTGSVSLWRADASNVAVLQSGRRAAVWTRGLVAEPSMSLVDGSGVAFYTEDGRNTSSALDLYVDELDGIYELSVMNRDWTIERFDLFTGDAEGTTAWPMPLASVRAARGLSRVDSGTDWTSYQPFLSNGDLFGAIRLATRCGRWVASTHIQYEQGSIGLDTSPTSSSGCAAAEWGGAISQPPDLPLMSEPLGEALAFNEGSDLVVAEMDSEPSVVMSSPGGQVARYSLSTIMSAREAVSPDEVSELAGTHTTLAASADLVVVGSLLAGSDGSTLHVLDPLTLELDAHFDAGSVLGVALVDLDRDGDTDILTGTQDGWLRGWSTDGTLLFEWSAGDFALGDNGALHAWQDDHETIVAAAVSGGWRVLSID